MSKETLLATESFRFNSQVPLILLWGEPGHMIYNDAYARFAGNRHPALLGSEVRTGWPEVSEFNDNIMKVGLSGGSPSYRDQELILFRRGKTEPVWMNLDYSPVIDETGEPAGVIAIVVETTQRVLADRYRETQQRRLAEMLDQGPSFMALLQGPEHRFEFANASYLRLIGGRNPIGKTVAEALPDAASQGYVDKLDAVFASGQSFSSVGSRYAMEAVRGGYEEANPALLRMYGKSREELIGHTVHEVFEPETAAELTAHLRACLLAGTPHRYERQNGDSIVEAVATPVLGTGGSLRRLVVSARDITEHRNLEQLCVSDNGTGMSQEVISRAFDPFFTTKPLGEGTGLGLSLVYGFARQSGGQTRIYPEGGKGTMVCLYLPRCSDTKEDVEEPAESVPIEHTKLGETVLIVDDEQTVRMLVTDVLEELGYIAVDAIDGKSGLQILESKRRIDLLITDVGLPGGMNGRQLADAGKTLRPELKILFITG